MAGPVWFKVRRELEHEPIVAGQIGGATPVFVERYIYQDIERSVSGIDANALVVQFGGGRVGEGERDRWRSMNLPSQSVLLPRGVPTHWHYSGTVDFAVFYFLSGGGRLMQQLKSVAESRDAPIPFSDSLVGAASLQLVAELQRTHGADAGFMERLCGVMLEHVYRLLVNPGARGINPRHAHFARLQAVLNYVHTHPAADLSVGRLAKRARISVSHFTRVFHEAIGVSPHHYVLAARLELARKLLGQSTLPISRIATECGFSSQSHLTASFRAAHATTPLKYRAHLQTPSR